MGCGSHLLRGGEVHAEGGGQLASLKTAFWRDRTLDFGPKPFDSPAAPTGEILEDPG